MPVTFTSLCRVSVLAPAALFLLSIHVVSLHADEQQPASSREGLPGTATPAVMVPPPSWTPPQSDQGPVQAPSAAVPPRKVAQGVPDAVIRNTVLTEDSVWRGEVRVEGGVTVAPQATLTIVPGTTIRFCSAATAPDERGTLVIQGRLAAVGTGDRPIRFSSCFDQPRPGDWQGIILLGSEKRNRLENCRVEGAEIAVDGAFSTITLQNSVVSGSRTGMRCRDCLLTMEGGGARQNDMGIVLNESEADLREVDVSGNRRGFEVVGASLSLSGSTMEKNGADALHADASRVFLVGNRVTDNGMGVTLLSSEGGVTGNVISGNHGYGVSLSRSRVRVSGNTIESNGGNGLMVADGDGIAWGNVISGNAPYDCYHAGSEEFLAIGNWWGSPDAAEVARRIYDRRADQRRGVVRHVPALTVRPAASR